MGRLRDRLLQAAVTGHGQAVRDQPEAGQVDVLTGRGRPALRTQSLDEALDASLVFRPSVDHQPRPGRHHVGCVGLDLEHPGGGDEMAGGRAGDPGRALLDPADQRGGGGQRIAAPFHRHGAGMARLALENNLDPRDADDRAHHPDGGAGAFEHRALLDMQFEKRPDVVAHGFRKRLWIAAERFQRLGERAPVGKNLGQQRLVEQARHSPRADAGNAAFAGLFGEEIDQFEAMAQRAAASGEAARDLEPREHA